MTTRVVKEGNVTTTVVDLTNGVGGRSAEVRKLNEKYEIKKNNKYISTRYNKYISTRYRKGK